MALFVLFSQHFGILGPPNKGKRKMTNRPPMYPPIDCGKSRDGTVERDGGGGGVASAPLSQWDFGHSARQSPRMLLGVCHAPNPLELGQPPLFLFALHMR